MIQTSNGISEEQLIENAINGDRASLAQLVKNYEQTVYNFSFKICRNKERAEHTMQETFLSMVKSLKQFSGNSKLSTWLYTIVSNHCLMLARSQKKYDYVNLENEEGLIDDKNVVDWKYSPEKLAENSELKNLLDEAIEKLPHDYRVVFLLRDVEGLSTNETAEIVNLSVPAIKSRLHRARAFLRNELDKKTTRMKKENVSCKDVMSHICDSLGEDLNSPKCINIKDHLENCPNCQKYFDSVDSTIKFYKKYNVELDNDGHERLLSVLGLKDE